MSHNQLSPIKVWDLPVRVMHWLLALSFGLAWLTAEVDVARGVHIMLGYTVIGLIVARLIWGLIGTRHARFAAFVRGPAEVLSYARAYLQGRPPHSTGHNPLGALAVVAMLGLGLATGLTGLAMCSAGLSGWGEAGEELHEALASAMLAVVGLHVLGVILSSKLHRENLARAMITGNKLGQPDEGIRRTWGSVAALVVVVVLGWWGWASQGAAQGGVQAIGAQVAGACQGEHESQEHGEHDEGEFDDE